MGREAPDEAGDALHRAKVDTKSTANEIGHETKELANDVSAKSKELANDMTEGAKELGNDIDQASLLIALLRAQGIPARYVRATLADADAQTLIVLAIAGFAYPPFSSIVAPALPCL